MSSIYYDNFTNINVLSTLLHDPKIMEQTERYKFGADDFAPGAQRTLFVAINNLWVSGLKNITLPEVKKYMDDQGAANSEKFVKENGYDLVSTCLSIDKEANFDYYFNRMKKFSLLRMFDNSGINVKDLYDPAAMMTGIVEQQSKWLEAHSITEIAAIIQNRIDEVIRKHDSMGLEPAVHAGENIEELIESLAETPEVGVPLPFSMWNGVHRGARRKKLYLCSALSGYGKTRNMVASMTYIACGRMYNQDLEKWEDLGWQHPALFITTELEISEIQTMMLAFISGVNEEKILDGSYSVQEKDRVMEAARIMSKAPLYIEELPDFSLQDVEDVVKFNIEQRNVGYIAMDYLHSSMKIIEEVARRSGGMKMQEHQILFMMAIKLKDIANQHDVFIMTATQLNRDGNSEKEASSAMLRGASAIADKVDYADIMRNLSETDKKMLPSLKSQLGIAEEPNFIREVFKNRRGAVKSGKIWCYADLGTCRIKPLFYTDGDYLIKDIKITEYREV